MNPKSWILNLESYYVLNETDLIFFPILFYFPFYYTENWERRKLKSSFYIWRIILIGNTGVTSKITFIFIKSLMDLYIQRMEDCGWHKLQLNLKELTFCLLYLINICIFNFWAENFRMMDIETIAWSPHFFVINLQINKPIGIKDFPF